MKFIAIPTLMVLLFIQTFSTWMMILDYNINKNYIATKLCKNRLRPQLHCNGQCVLMKKIKQQEEREQNVPGTLKLEILKVVVSSSSFFADIHPSIPLTKKVFLPLVNSGKPVDRTSPIFHPPAV